MEDLTSYRSIQHHKQSPDTVYGGIWRSKYSQARHLSIYAGRWRFKVSPLQTSYHDLQTSLWTASGTQNAYKLAISRFNAEK
jgi:hypothetical protein